MILRRQAWLRPVKSRGSDLMLITISGMVGSGKSTTAKRIVELLDASGVHPECHRFRSLNLFGTTEESRHFSGPQSPPEGDGERGARFRPRRLTSFYALGYAARVIAFRVSGIGSSTRCVLFDRYFYDNFIQYELTSRLERLYLALLRAVIPRPDIALLLIASEEAISKRRPEYAREYVAAVCRRYERLGNFFPHLICFRTDMPDSQHEAIAELILGSLNGNQGDG